MSLSNVVGEPRTSLPASTFRGMGEGETGMAQMLYLAEHVLCPYSGSRRNGLQARFVSLDSAEHPVLPMAVGHASVLAVIAAYSVRTFAQVHRVEIGSSLRHYDRQYLRRGSFLHTACSKSARKETVGATF